MLVMILCRLQPRILPRTAITIRMKPAIRNGKGTIMPDLGAGMHLVLSSFRVWPSGQARSTIWQTLLASFS